MTTFDDALLDAPPAPLGDLIASVGLGIADAQRALDLASFDVLQAIYGSTDGPYRELQRIGYRPNWYHIPEATGEISVALTVAGTQNGAPATPHAPLAAAPLPCPPDVASSAWATCRDLHLEALRDQGTPAPMSTA